MRGGRKIFVFSKGKRDCGCFHAAFAFVCAKALGFKGRKLFAAVSLVSHPRWQVASHGQESKAQAGKPSKALGGDGHVRLLGRAGSRLVLGFVTWKLQEAFFGHFY
jgi:hypothetical protein